MEAVEISQMSGRPVVLLVVAAMSACSLWGGAFDKAFLKGVTDRPRPSYAPGEEMTFTIRVDGATALPTNEYFIAWKRTGDDGNVVSGKEPLSLERPLVVKTSLDRPGFVRVTARVVDKDGSPIEKPGAKGGWESRQVFFDGGAGVQPEKLTAGVPEPKDFDAFWSAHKAALTKVPMKADVKEVESPDKRSRRYQVSVACAGERPATGFLLVPSKPGKYPARIELCGYGDSCAGTCWIGGDPNSLVFCLNAHGYELGREKAYYRSFMKSVESNGREYAFDPVQNADPKTCYFAGMTWRLLRALEYLKSRPEWNGRDLTSRGGSQGGLQAIWAAALDPDVTSALVGFPWCCDMSGKDVLKRNADSWRIRWAEGLGYYDPVHLARRIPATCKVNVFRAGLGDYCCPPSGVTAFWNAMRCPKKIRWVQGSTHNWEPPQPNQEYTLEEPAVTDVTALAKKEFSTCGKRRWLKASKGETYPGVIFDFDRADWSAYDRLVIDVVSHGQGGDRLMAYVKDPRQTNSQSDWIVDFVTVRPFGVTRWIVGLKKPRATPFDLTGVRQLHLFSDAPRHPNYEFAAVRLVRPGDPLPPEMAVPEEVAKAGLAFEAKCLEVRRQAMERLSPMGDLRLGVATAMEKIRPDVPADERVRPIGKGVQLKLAKNEHEALQILVGNAGGRVAKDVRVTVSDLELERKWYQRLGRAAVLAATNFHVGVTGYVRTRSVPRYPVAYNVPTNTAAGYVRLKKRPETGWYPDPILGFMDGTDVKPGDLQSFFVDLKCPKGQPAGVYAGVLSVSSGDARVEVPLRVKVWDFELGDASPMPLAITFHVEPLSNPCRGDVERELDAWADFLADHFITIDSLYNYEQPRWKQLQRLKSQGRLGLFNLAMWQNFKRSPEAEKAFRDPKNGVSGWGEVRMDAAYAKAKELGLLDHAYMYGMDEIPPRVFPSMKASLPYYKRRYPEVPVMTTCYDDTYGEDGVLSDIDVFIPDTTKYDCAQADKARAHGRRVWWYLANVPHPPYANFYVECEGIEARSLMGAQAIRFRPDGFLYYQTAQWRANRPVTSGPFTDWDPLSYGGGGNEYHGDGSWTVVGPGGRPLETFRLYNFRDGLEDYAYAKLYREKFGRWPEVPATIVDSMTNFNVSASAHYRWRDDMADLIETDGKR